MFVCVASRVGSPSAHPLAQDFEVGVNRSILVVVAILMTCAILVILMTTECGSRRTITEADGDGAGEGSDGGVRHDAIDQMDADEFIEYQRTGVLPMRLRQYCKLRLPRTCPRYCTPRRTPLPHAASLNLNPSNVHVPPQHDAFVPSHSGSAWYQKCACSLSRVSRRAAPSSLTLLTHPPLSLASLEDAFMQKVLQPQVAHAAFTLNPHRETEAVERIVKRRASVEQDEGIEVPDEGLVAEPSTHELDLALDIVLKSAQGKDAALSLWMTHRPPKWFRRMHSVHHSWGALYTLIIVLHCAFTFVEAPMGRGFAWGGGADAYLIVAVGAIFFIFHYAECVMCFITAIMTTNRKLLSDTGEWKRCEGNNARDFCLFRGDPSSSHSCLSSFTPPPTTHHPQHHHVLILARPVWVFTLITVMWIEWCISAAGTHGGSVQEVATRQSIRRACVSVFDGQNHTAPWASNVDECVMFCTSILPRPVAASLAPGATVAALSGCAERALSEVRNGTVLKHLKHIPSQQSQLVNGVLLLLPVTAILRPVVVLMKITSIRRALAHFVGTLQAATSTFILFSFIVLIATVQATLIFYNRGMDMDNLLTTYACSVALLQV